MRESHDSLVSSMAAHNSPRGFTPAALNAAFGTRCSVLPMPSSPSALARRLAGSTVRTSTLEPWLIAAIRAEAAAVVVLPTPPGPQATTISLVASRLYIVRTGASASTLRLPVRGARAAITGRAPRRASRPPASWYAARATARRGRGGRGAERRDRCLRADARDGSTG